MFYEVVSLFFLGNTDIRIAEGGDCIFKNSKANPTIYLIVSDTISLSLYVVLTPVSKQNFTRVRFCKKK